MYLPVADNWAATFISAIYTITVSVIIAHNREGRVIAVEGET